ncbi:MAG: aminotransferase class I/II-fold pyridoxal phosphate-dependent enzyme, partial [Pirellulaceae bacterium]|nr:aminotransferase class I/II-fold pyridoxal phosphate-dependent enzyme [Pirellulaceae bacterium]
DPTQEQWRQLAELLARKELLPMFDIAYQGFGKGVAEDVQGLHTVAAAVKELLVCNSFSKNFGLYSERVGGLTLVSETAEIAQATFSQAKLAVRANYSNPPRHGGEIVVTILSDPQLKDEWLSELATMRERIQKMRTLIVETMKKYSDQDFSFIEQQLGMFSFTGLSPQQVERLQKEHGVYIVGSGRINVAGVTPANVESLCQAIGQVL